MKEIEKSSRIDDEVVQDQRQRDDNDLQDKRQDQPKEEEVEPRRCKMVRTEKLFGPDFVSFMVEIERASYREAILPQAVSDFATPVIEKNVIESLEAAVLARSSSQPKSTYEAAASLFEFELTKILIDNMEKNKSYDKANYKKELYGEVFTLKRSRDNKNKDQDPSARSDRGTKRRKSSKEAKSSKDSRSKENKSLSTSKDASHSQHKPSGKSAYAEETSHTVDDSGADWFKKPERPPIPDPDWNKRQCVDFRPLQTWISKVARAKEHTTSFDELINTPIDFSAFILNRLNINDLTQAILVGLTFDLLKGTCKSLTELEYHLEECSKAITE
ncbi:hypothetical protein Tco_0987014 [Tanacetum coccineum]